MGVISSPNVKWTGLCFNTLKYTEQFYKNIVCAYEKFFWYKNRK